MATTMGNNEPERLFREYVAICNRALQENKDNFWMKMETQLSDKLWNGGNFRTIIYDRDPGAVVDEITCRFNQHPQSLEVLPQGDHNIALSWKTPLSYLQDVVARPQWYIENPIRLDWGWVRQRVRDEAEYRIDNRSLATGIAIGAAGALAVAAFARRRGRHQLHG